MSTWGAVEMAESQMDEARHVNRLAKLLTELSERPANSIPSACRGWTETVAAYRFLDNPSVGFAEILSGHKAATLERLRLQEVALLVQDTSFLNYGTLKPKVGMGTVKERSCEEYLLHTTVAFTPERVNLGVLGAKLWQRTEEPVAHHGLNYAQTSHYVPIDFERETLTAGLATGGIKLNAATFFSWLGVTQYLSPATVLRTLREIAELAAPGSEIVFQFIIPAATLAGEESSLVTTLAAQAAAVGEPWLSFFDPEDLEAHLRQMGFGQVRRFGPQQATERYLLGRTDGLRVPAYFQMMNASVG